MSTTIINVLIAHPFVLFLTFIIKPLAGAALAYYLVWLAMRPKAANDQDLFLWHLTGVAVTITGSAMFRIIAMVTFAGRSAYDLPTEGGVAGFYILIVPSIVAAGYIALLKKKMRQLS